MAAEIFFLDIPVNRIAEDLYYAKMNKEIDAAMYPGPPAHNERLRRMREEDPGREQYIRDHLRQRFGGPWKYNEIIGYIRLHFLGTQIRGEWWRVTAKRIVKTRKKTFECWTWKLAPEIDVPDNASNQEIFALVRQYVDDCRKELGPKRYVDESSLLIIGPFVDWRNLMRSNV